MDDPIAADMATVTTKDGTVLTDDDFEKMADEAEAGYDLSGWKPRVGRPVLNGDGESHSPRIAVRVPRSLFRSVQTKACAENRTLSAVVRELLETYAAT